MRCALLVCLLVLSCLAGCRDNGRFPTYPAGGTVRFADGRPLAGGAILCESPHGLAARAVINDDGTFQLGTYDIADGAVEGTHRATVQPPATADVDPDSGGGKARRALIDDRFMTFETSGIVFDVKSSGVNQFEVVVTPPAR